VRREHSDEQIRALIVSLSTYSSPFNDQKLAELGRRIENVTAIAADVPTLWGAANQSRSHETYAVHVLAARHRRSAATTRLLNLDSVAVEARPTVIHVESEPWQGVAVQSVLLAQRLGVPVGVQFAENGPLLRGAGGAFRITVGKWVLRRCRYAIGWSSESTDIARRLVPGIRTETAPGTGVTMSPPTSVDRAERWFGASSDRPLKIAFVGRFSPEKGLADFLAVADRSAMRMPVRIAIAGGMPSHPTVRDWVASRPWARVHGTLPRAAVSDLLAAADVLVSTCHATSFWKEQFGKAAAESMAVGTPVFAFDCGALKEVIGDGGVVVHEGAVDALVAELERYFREPGTAREELAKRARMRAASFTDSVLAEGLVRIWRDLLSDTQPTVTHGRQ
jgi:glycosyltransferase involved in cell wall biosynthesis